MSFDIDRQFFLKFSYDLLKTNSQYDLSLSDDDYDRFDIIWNNAMNKYLDTMGLDQDELNLIKRKKFMIYELFSTSRKEWTFARTRYSNFWKEKLKGILMNLLEKNNLIDTLTNWAKNVVWFNIFDIVYFQNSPFPSHKLYEVVL